MMARGAIKKRMVKLVVDIEVYRDIVKETLQSTIGFSLVPSARHGPNQHPVNKNKAQRCQASPISPSMHRVSENVYQIK